MQCTSSPTQSQSSIYTFTQSKNTLSSNNWQQQQQQPKHICHTSTSGGRQTGRSHHQQLHCVSAQQMSACCTASQPSITPDRQTDRHQSAPCTIQTFYNGFQCPFIFGLFFILFKSVSINVTQSSILMIECVICYVALPFSHTFKQMGNAAWQSYNTLLYLFQAFVTYTNTVSTQALKLFYYVLQHFLYFFLQCFYTFLFHFYAHRSIPTHSPYYTANVQYHSYSRLKQIS